MAQVIKYQTTTVSPDKSVIQIQGLIQKYGGTRFEITWSGSGNVNGLRFALKSDEWGEVPVRLDAPTERIEEILYRRTNMRTDKRKQAARRIAWRHLKDLVEQLLLSVESGVLDVIEAFFSKIETTVEDEDGRPYTMGRLIMENPETIPVARRLSP